MFNTLTSASASASASALEARRTPLLRRAAVDGPQFIGAADSRLWPTEEGANRKLNQNGTAADPTTQEANATSTRSDCRYDCPIPLKSILEGIGWFGLGIFVVLCGCRWCTRRSYAECTGDIYEYERKRQIEKDNDPNPELYWTYENGRHVLG